jgi:alkanesulfonate monooxygenase SsuD/methylene tetrahydromethanopterin reductase-like flavin-dependent oxidoreductase (luciferase family)
MLGVNVVCAETDEEAHLRAAPGALAFLRLRQGKPGLYPSPEEAAAYNFTPFERESVRSWTGSHVIGDPATVRAQLEDLVARTGADELMLTTMLYATDDRIRSYELVADEVALDRTAA